MKTNLPARSITAVVLGLVLALALATPADRSPGAATDPVDDAVALAADETTLQRRHLVVGSTGAPLIAVVGVDRDGALSEVPGSPFPTGVLSLGVAITPDARTVYSAHTVSGTLVGYRIAADGSLSEIPGARLAPGGPVVGVAVSPDGRRLFITAGMLPVRIRSYDISETGALSPTGAAPVRVDGATFSQVSIAPSGRHLVFSSWSQNNVSSYAIAPDASLTPVSAQVPAGDKPVMPVFTPDGRYVYVSNEISGTTSGYAVSRRGELTPTPGSPYPSLLAHGAAISPDGRHLYTPENGRLGGFSIGADGSLTPLPGSPFSAATARVVISPDGKRLFAVDGHSSVTTLIRNPDGTASPSGLPPAPTRVPFSDGQIAAITPNIGPVAALRLVSRSGSDRTFSAAGSTDRDGRVARYRWTFGDGTALTTGSPQVTHHYRTTGPYTVTVTVVDDEGCSTRLVYTGTTATCTGTPRARETLVAR